jgi:hypothetical protein
VSNRVIAGWGLAVAIMLILIALVPAAQTFTRTTALHGPDWVLVIGAAAAATLWREIAKYIGVIRTRRTTTAPAGHTNPNKARETTQPETVSSQNE